MKFTIKHWEERNSQANLNKNKTKNLIKALKENDRNRDELKAPVRKCLDKVLSVMEKRKKEQLEIKIKILRDKIKKENKMSMML